MNALDVYINHNQTINNYLVIYAAAIVLLIVIAFIQYRYTQTKSFHKGLFFTLLVGGLVLAGSGLNFIGKNLQERSVMVAQYKNNPKSFLTERFEAASHYKEHFCQLLNIWCIAVGALALLSLVFFKRKIIVGVFTGLAICCIASLLLDFSGFRSDARYYAELEKLISTSQEK